MRLPSRLDSRGSVTGRSLVGTAQRTREGRPPGAARGLGTADRAAVDGHGGRVGNSWPTVRHSGHFRHFRDRVGPCFPAASGHRASPRRVVARPRRLSCGAPRCPDRRVGLAEPTAAGGLRTADVWTPSDWTGEVAGPPVPGTRAAARAGSGDRPGAPPGAYDVSPTYEGQAQCDPTAKPGTQALADLIKATYGQTRRSGSRVPATSAARASTRRAAHSTG